MAQLQELWTTGLTNTSVLDPSPPPDASLTNYVFTEGTVDRSGNTIVAGIAYVNLALDPETRSNYSAVLVEKISSRGEPLWQYFDPEALVEALETDLAGNIFFIAGQTVTRTAALVKLSPDGRKLWQVTQDEEGQILRRTATVNIDYAGNTYFFVFRTPPSGSNSPAIDLVLSKIDPRGGKLWSQTLQWDGKVFDNNALSKALVVFADGGVAAAAGNTIWKFDRSGRIEWTTDKGYPSILANPKGTICATWFGQAYAVFSREGKLLESGTGLSGQGLDVQCVSRQGNFLLANYGVIEELSANGRERWHNIIRLWSSPGAVPEKDGGWLVVAGDPAMNLIRLDKGGTEISRTPIPGYFDTSPVPANWYIRQPIHKAPDGTIRVIYNLRTGDFGSFPYGVVVAAFQEQR
jgi:hypothetical protein